MSTIANLLTENRTFAPSAAFKAQANLRLDESGTTTYGDPWAVATADPLAFWEEQARRLSWAEPWHTAHTWKPATPDSTGELSVPHADAAANAGRSALLVVALGRRPAQRGQTSVVEKK